jgi:WD40 repeat protein
VWPSDDSRLVVSGGFDGVVCLWEFNSRTCLRTLRSPRRYERLDITGLTGITEVQRTALLALRVIERHGRAGEPTTGKNF